MDHVLKSTITGFYRGAKINRPYRAVLMHRDGQIDVIRVDELLGDLMWNPTPGSWRVDTLTKWMKDPAHHEILYIDFGEHWAVAGVREALVEAAALVMEGVPDYGEEIPSSEVGG